MLSNAILMQTIDISVIFSFGFLMIVQEGLFYCLLLNFNVFM